MTSYNEDLILGFQLVVQSVLSNQPGLGGGAMCFNPWLSRIHLGWNGIIEQFLEKLDVLSKWWLSWEKQWVMVSSLLRLITKAFSFWRHHEDFHMNKYVRALFSSCLRLIGYVIPLQLGVFTENVVMAGSFSIMVPKLNQLVYHNHEVSRKNLLCFPSYLLPPTAFKRKVLIR